jgi:two-component system LytT family sensor kinase
MKRTVIILLHAGYWLLYLLLNVMFIRLMYYKQADGSTSWNHGNFLSRQLHILFFSPVSTFSLLPGLLGFYSFYTILYTRFLKRKRIVGLFISGILIAAVCGALVIFLMRVGWGATFNNGWDTFLPIWIFFSLLTLVHGMIGLVLRGFIVSYGDIQLKEDLNKKNYEMELALVKSQLNPHFLFNTINNIDVLIEKDPAKASAYLNKLSDIMRFMLYETKTEKIPLTKELTYIGKFIDLQKIRAANQNYVNYAVEGDAGGIWIEPMLFIPFIENAFKHAVNKRMENAIHIRVIIEEEKIIFVCENNYNKDLQERPDHSGLGNGLIEKRLILLYPGKHTLEIGAENETYKVKLTLTDAN